MVSYVLHWREAQPEGDTPGCGQDGKPEGGRLLPPPIG